MGCGAEVRAEPVGRSSVLCDGDLQLDRRVGGKRRALERHHVGARRHAGAEAATEGAAFASGPSASIVNRKTCCPMPCGVAIRVDVITVVRRLGEPGRERAGGRVEVGVQVSERGKVVANHDQMHHALHVDVVVEERRGSAERVLAHLERRAKPGSLHGPELRDDLRRAAEQGEDPGLLDRSDRSARDAAGERHRERDPSKRTAQSAARTNLPRFVLQAF